MKVPGGAWKWVGLAGVAGVAATGAVVARDRRRRQQLTPDQIRSQLHRRLAEIDHPERPRTPTTEEPPAVPHVPVKRRRH